MLSYRLHKTLILLTSRRHSSRSARSYKSWPNDWVPFHWSRPVQVPGYYDSGDLVEFTEPDPQDIFPDFRNSEELKKLDPSHPIRMMFSLDHSKTGSQSKAYVERHIGQLGLIHKVDHANSLESKITSLTYSLRQAHATIKSKGEDNTDSSSYRKMANNVKYRRNRYLNELKELHLERYERIIKALQIELKENLFNVEYHRPYRKIQMRLLAIEYAKSLKEKKVAEFIESLDREKNEFEQHKQKTLEWIAEQEKKLVPSNVQ